MYYFVIICWNIRNILILNVINGKREDIFEFVFSKLIDGNVLKNSQKYSNLLILALYIYWMNYQTFFDIFFDLIKEKIKLKVIKRYFVQNKCMKR